MGRKWFRFKQYLQKPPLKTALDTLTHLNLKYPWEELFMSLQPGKLRLKDKD